jgi:undecaprenyl diphosphate synthase
MNMNNASGVSCVGIIMDGNRRWARARGLQSFKGHTAGLEKAREIVRHAFSRGVETVILYAFSMENWNRPLDEIKYLMNLFSRVLLRELDELSRGGVQARFIGDLSRLPDTLRAAAQKLEEESSRVDSNKKLFIALSYGGRAEILAAANQLLAEGKKEVREKDMCNVLWSRDMSDPDLIIRTGGEKRLSNFLPWQSVYSELFFSDSLWPDFTKEEFDSMLAEFGTRERRRGK